MDTNLPNTRATATLNKRNEKVYYKNKLIWKDISYDYDGTTNLSKGEFEYDPRGRVEKVTEYTDNSTWDYSDTVYEYEDAKDSTWTGYSDYSNVTITRENDNPAPDSVTRVAYNEGGQMIAVKHPHDSSGTKLEKYDYNGDGTLKQKAAWDGGVDPEWIQCTYDTFNRLKTITYPDSGGYIENNYDGVGRRISTEDHRDTADNIGGTGLISYEYNPLGQIISYTDQDGYTIRYLYHSSGQKQAITVNDAISPDNIIYSAEYKYDVAGRLKNVGEPLQQYGYQNIAGFDYDNNGNRSQLTYYRNGSEAGPTVSVGYTYNLDNYLTKFTTTGGPTYTFGGTDGPQEDLAEIDGLGRLCDAEETISNTSTTVDFSYDFVYDMRSQLKQASIEKNSSPYRNAVYNYRKDGNLDSRTINSSTTSFTYAGDLMDTASGGESFDLDFDDNGNMTTGVSQTITYNWDNKLRTATKGTKSISLRYDPDGNRIRKQSIDGADQITRKYIVDIVGDLPTTLMEIDPNIGFIVKTYIYANGQALSRHDGDYSAPRYFYIHDRLGSVRQIINTSASVVRYYTYEPFGEVLEEDGTLSNNMMFTGQYFDTEIDQYYLRARQYDPHISRFTARDPVLGNFSEPLTLHVYLYCENDPLNLFDPNGASSRSAALGMRQFTFDHYMILWAHKMDPFDVNPYKAGIRALISVIGKEAIRYYLTLGSSSVLKPVWAGAGAASCGPNMYVIAYYRLIQHGMINAILREDFGESSDLYDIQDLWAGL